MYALGRLGCSSGSDHCREGARRAVELFAQFGERARLADALIQQAFVERNWLAIDAADTALARAEQLVDASTPLFVQQRLACGQVFRAADHGDLAAQAVAAPRRQAELGRMAGDSQFGELIGLHNVGSAELEAGRLDEAVATMTEVVARHRAQHSPNTMGASLAINLSIALALRGDDIDLLPLAREGHVKSRLVGSAGGAIMAAALQHARQGDYARAAVLAGFGEADLGRAKCKPDSFDRALPGRVLGHCKGRLADEALVRLVARGAELEDQQAAHIAFDGDDWNEVGVEALPGLRDDPGLGASARQPRNSRYAGLSVSSQ